MLIYLAAALSHKLHTLSCTVTSSCCSVMAVDPENMSLSDAIEATEHLVLRDLPAHVPVGPLPVGPLTPSTLPLKEFLGL